MAIQFLNEGNHLEIHSSINRIAIITINRIAIITINRIAIITIDRIAIIILPGITGPCTEILRSGGPAQNNKTTEFPWVFG